MIKNTGIPSLDSIKSKFPDEVLALPPIIAPPSKVGSIDVN